MIYSYKINSVYTYICYGIYFSVFGKKSFWSPTYYMNPKYTDSTHHDYLLLFQEPAKRFIGL